MATPTPEADAKGDLRKMLDEIGIGGATDWAWEQYLNGSSLKQIMIDVRDQPAHINRFQGFKELQAKGRAVDEATWIAAEKSYATMMRAYGFPATFYDGPEDFAKLIVGGVGQPEFQDRLEMAARVVATDPDAMALRNELAEKYGFTNADGLAAAYWIDPDKAADLIQKQYRAASSSAASIKAGFGSLTKDQAERVGAGRYSADYLAQAFGKIGGMDEFTQQLPGEGDPALTDDDLIAAGIEGNADAAQRVAKKARTRTAAFEGGGNFAGGQTGVTGIGSAAT